MSLPFLHVGIVPALKHLVAMADVVLRGTDPLAADRGAELLSSEAERKGPSTNHASIRGIRLPACSRARATPIQNAARLSGINQAGVEGA